MNRRQILKGFGLATTGAISMSLPTPSFGQKILSADVNNAKLVNAKNSFNQAFANNPNLIGFANIEQDYLSCALEIEGSLPKDINGSFYRNGPAKQERDNMRYLHLFEGDGMVHQFQFHDGKITHQGKFVQTPKFKQEQQANRFLYSGPDSRLDNSLSVSNSDTINTANTNILPVGDELWALWEAGSATAICADTLETKGQINLGLGSKYGDKLKGLAFSAHPKVESNGDIWNFGMAPSGHIVLYHLNSLGLAKNVGLVNARYRGGMLHDFLITHKHILLILPSFSIDPSIDGFFARMQYAGNIPMRVLVVDKQTLSLKKEYELESGFAFHYGNAWEEQNGTIHFDASLYNSADVLHSLADIMQGKTSNGDHHAKTVLFTLKADGTTSKTTVDGNSEFPRVFTSKTGIKNTYLFTLGSDNTSVWSDSIHGLDLESGKKDSYVYGNDFLVEEHVPIHSNGLEEQGYLVGTALHVPTKRTCLNIFHSNKLSDGPICRAWLPYHIPLGFHGNFKAG